MTAEPTVFVVDDDPGVRRSLRALARSAGLAVEAYASGGEFLEAYDPRRGGCLLLDVQLLDRNGLDVQDELSRRQATLPVIVMTGNADVATCVRAFKGGAADFLEKPVSPPLLLERIRAAMERDRQAREMVREVDFVASMSHEVRTPLQTILGYQELLLKGAYGALTSEQAQILERMRRSSKWLFALVKATLELSRLQAKTIPLELEDISLKPLIDELAAEIRVLHRNPAVAVAWRVAPGLPTLRTDPQKLKIVLSNLVLNAIKYTERGSVTIRVRRDGDGIAFAVRDTGPGIAAEFREAIFEPFRRAENTWTRRTEGVGWGLYLVRRLVERFAGHVTLKSDVGRGSCFRVWVPLDVKGHGTERTG